MNEFKEGYKVERASGGEIIITDALKDILIEMLKGNLTKKDVMNKTGIADKTTVELKVKQLVAQNPELKLLFEEYISRKSVNFNGYNFRAEAIDMLRNDYSQSQMAEKIGVNRRSFSTKIKKLQADNSNNELGELLRRHAVRKMKRKEITEEEKIAINCILDEYEEKYPVGLARYENRNPIEARLEVITKLLDTVDNLVESGTTLKELSDRKVISESGYRKYREEAESLNKILNGRDRKEE